VLDDGFRSYPSGHSSSSAAGMRRAFGQPLGR
jgi:membrane-associated phospholipid phosphatase